jgi:lambda repressor-like predicted transcriptional regulator
VSTLIAARTDANQAEIVAALRAAGCSVVSLHRVGDGVPDLLVGRAGKNWLLEVKIPGRGLNEKQKDWHRAWGGQRAVVTTVEGALTVVGLLK